MRIKTTIIYLLGALCCVASLSFLVSCGQTSGEVIDSYKPQYAELRAEFTELAKLIPDEPMEMAASDLAPKPTFKEWEISSNTSIIMMDNLLEPDLDLAEDDRFDLILSNWLIKNVQDTGNKSGMSESDRSDKAYDTMAERFESLLGIRYLGVAQVLQHHPAVAVSDDRFDGGYVALAGYLIDREQKKLVASCVIEARPQTTVSYSYRQGESKATRLQDFANSTMFSNARRALCERLAEQTGGTFDVD